VVLASAEVHVGGAGAAHIGPRVEHEVQEALEGDLDAAPDRLAELALHGAGVVGDLGRDRLDRLVREARQHRAQDVGGLGRDGGERAGRLGHLSPGYKDSPREGGSNREEPRGLWG
jgi:hypothetical protein